jgi:hypothetical protein
MQGQQVYPTSFPANQQVYQQQYAAYQQPPQQQQQQQQQLAPSQQEQLRAFWQGQLQEVQQVGNDPTEFKNHQLPLARIKKVRWHRNGPIHEHRLFLASRPLDAGNLV